MPTVHLEAHLSSDDLLQAVQQLDLPELAQFLARVVALRAQRQAPRLGHAETELLVKVNRGLPDEQRQRYDCLAEKRDQETLTPEEYAELLRLTEQIEQLQADRIAALSALAQLDQLRESAPGCASTQPWAVTCNAFGVKTAPPKKP